jgi:hypothetical protein
METDDPIAYMASLCVLQGIEHEIRDNGKTLYVNGTIQLPSKYTIRGTSIKEIYVDELSVVSSTPRKAKKAQWKSERSIFNRANQGKKSK